jgi:hypothetical protein
MFRENFPSISPVFMGKAIGSYVVGKLKTQAKDIESEILVMR